MDFLSLFLREFLKGYSPKDAGWFFLYIISILIIIVIIYKVKNNHLIAKKIIYLILVLGITGTLYGMTLLLKALGSHAIPEQTLSFYLFNGLGHAIQPLILAFFGWLIVSVIDIFMKQERWVYSDPDKVWIYQNIFVLYHILLKNNG